MLKGFLYLYIFPYMGFLLFKIISSTYRVRIIKPEIELNILKRGQVPIYALWHQRFFPGVIIFATRKPISVMISQSKDGELIAKMLPYWDGIR